MRRAQYICLLKTASNRRCKPATHFAYRSGRDAKMRPSLSTTHSASVPLSSTRHPVTPTSVLGHRILAFSAGVVGPRQDAAKQDCGGEQPAQRGAAATVRLDRGDGARPR